MGALEEFVGLFEQPLGLDGEGLGAVTAAYTLLAAALVHLYRKKRRGRVSGLLPLAVALVGTALALSFTTTVDPWTLGVPVGVLGALTPAAPLLVEAAYALTGNELTDDDRQFWSYTFWLLAVLLAAFLAMPAAVMWLN